MGRAVFNGVPTVVADTKDMVKDNSLPDGGSLQLDSTASDSAFKAADGDIVGMPGLDGKLVHGNTWEDVDGDHGMAITGSEIHNTFKNQTMNIGLDVDHTIGQNFTFSIHGAHNEVHVGPQNLTFLSAQCESREAPKQMQESTSKFECKLVDLSWVHGLELAMNYGVKAEVDTGLKVEFDNVFINVLTLKGEAVLGEQVSDGITTKMQGLANKVMGVKAEAGGAEAKAIPEINVLVVFIPDGFLG